MAQDKSVIKVPGISSTQIVPKINTSTQEELVFNNGVYISKSSLNKTLPKSLVRLWKNGNKLYLFNRDTTVLEKIIKYFANTNSDLSISAGSEFTQVTNNDNLSILVRNMKGTSTLFTNIGSSNNLLDEATIKSTLVSSNIIVNSEILENKQLKIYKLKRSISTDYVAKYFLPYVEEQEKLSLDTIDNSNFFLRLKSIFTSKEILSNYDNFVYFLSIWIFPFIDNTLNLSTFDIIKSNKNIKSKLLGPLIENDLELYRNIVIINNKNINYNFVNKIENVNIQNANNNVLGEKKALSLIKDFSFITPEAGNVLVFINKQNNYIFSILVNSVEDAYITTAGGGADTVNNVAIRYELKPIYNTTNGPSYLTTFNSLYTPELQYNFDMYTIPLNSYQRIIAYNQNVTELEINDSTFNTITDGDYYVVEID